SLGNSRYERSGSRKPNNYQPGAVQRMSYDLAGTQNLPESAMSTSKLIIVIVVAALALTVGAVAVSKRRTAAVMSKYNDGLHNAGTLGIQSLQYKVQLYLLDVGSLPVSLNDLLAAPAEIKGWQGPYARPRELIDPFGHPFAYK